MGFSIEIDYRFDATGFFDDPAARAAMERAAAIWEGLILDDFEAVPAGISFDIADPSAPGTERRVVLDQPIEDILVFVGAASLGGPLGEGGPGGRALGGLALGDAFERRVAEDFRGTGPVTDVEPWAGTITFEPDAPWSFALDGPVEGRDDFLTIALHELAHVFGIGTLPAFEALVSDSRFAGPNALAETGGAGVPLDATLHVVDGFRDGSVLMDPTATRGERKLPGPVDLAMLADIGYRIAGLVPVGSLPPLASEGDDGVIFGTAVADLIDGLGGADQIQGEGGDDTLIGGAGDDVLFGGTGADAFVFAPGAGRDQIPDFEPGTDRILVSPAFGFADAAAVLAALARPFSNVSRLELDAETSLDIFHDSAPESPLAAADIAIATVLPPILGTGGDDAGLAGTAGDDVIRAGGGNDAILGSAGSDLIEGQAGVDRVIYDGSRTAFRPMLDAEGGLTVAKPGGGTDRLTGIEWVSVAEGDFLYGIGSPSLDLGYRLYAAAFARTPDAGGLLFWVDALDTGLTQRAAAAAFVGSREFADRYGAAPSDAEFVTALYRNVLERDPDEGGFGFWFGQFAAGTTREEMLIAFAGSRENVEATRPDLENGVFVTDAALDLLL